MNKKDVLELTRRFKKDGCTFTRLCGCYVSAQKEIILRINENFLNLDDDEFYKYLEIAKKTLSGKVGNNLLELEFMPEEEAPGGRQQFLMGLRSDALKSGELLERLYEQIIAGYEHQGNYLILIFHDAYDVITKTNDNNKLDESEEVYEYILCAICPVELSKAALGYREDENRIGSRIRDWVVLPPEKGFVFPSFSDRSSDIHALIYYTKNPKDARPEFMEGTLGCMPKRTATEEKKVFQEILDSVAEPDGNEAIILDIQQTISGIVEEHNASSFEGDEPILLNSQTLKSVIQESEIPDEIAEKIEKYCEDEFGDAPPVAENLIDPKALAEMSRKLREQELQKEVISLKKKLEELPAKDDEIPCDIVLNVKPEKAALIKTQLIDGVKYIVIPVEDGEQAAINGEQADI